MHGTAYGGYNVYGYKLGVLMLETTFPRIVGDIGNAQTWNFPVLFKTVKGATSKKVVLELTKEDVQPFIDAAKELEAQGVKAITTSCGFLALFQNELREAVNVPVIASALVMVPWVYSMIAPNGKVGILTANSDTLTAQHLKAVGVDKIPNVIYGLQKEEVFTNFTVQNWDSVDTAKCEEELVRVARKMVEENPDVKAIVLECTNMPPYTEAIKEAVGLPVFDLVSMVNFVITSV